MQFADLESMHSGRWEGQKAGFFSHFKLPHAVYLEETIPGEDRVKKKVHWLYY